MIPYRKGNKWGYCDRNKNIVIDYEYDDARPFVGSYAQVRVNEQKGVINHKGEFQKCEGLWEEIFKKSFWNRDIKSCKKYSKKEVNLLDRFESYIKFDNQKIDLELYAVKSFEKWGFVDKHGQELIPFIYDEVLPFSEGFAAVCIDKNWGYIDKNGNGLIENSFSSYKEVKSFSEGYATVMIYDDEGVQKWGYINCNGNSVFEFSSGSYFRCQYDRVSPFNGGLSYIEVLSVSDDCPWDGTYIVGYIDRYGQKYWQEWFDWNTYKHSYDYL